MSRAVHRAGYMILALLIAAIGLLAQAVLTTSHLHDADATWKTCSHQTQSIHELSDPPASWPGTRAAHIVTRFSASNQQAFYTKSSILDPTWDIYKIVVYPNC